MTFDNDGQRNLTQPTDELDRMLDAALAKYVAVEPRAGLEGRVLAHLRAEQLPASRRLWLQWALVGTVAVIALVAILAWRSNRSPHPVIANHSPATIQRPSIQKPNSAATATELAAAKPPSMRRPAVRRALPSRAVLHTKLDQFPSTQPLSAEELALAKYVKNFPKEARLVAQAQEEFDLETQKVMNDAGAEIPPSTSNQER